MPKQGARLCTATAQGTGERCTREAIRGATVCDRHGGNAGQVRSKAAVRAEIAEWLPGTPTLDPGEVFLGLVTQSKARCVMYAAEVQRMADEHDGNLQDALTDSKRGEFGPVGEFTRAMVELEERERDRCAGFAAKAIAAGLAERMVRLAERQAEVIAQIVLAAVATPEAGLSDEQREIVQRAAGRQLRELTA